MSQQPAGIIPEWTMGDRLQKAREVLGLNTREFAELIGVSQKTVTDAENDNRSPRRIMLNAWSLATGVSRDWLETGINPDPTGGHARTGGLLRRVPSIAPVMIAA